MKRILSSTVWLVAVSLYSRVAQSFFTTARATTRHAIVGHVGTLGQVVPTVPILCSGENFTVVAKPGGVPCHASDYIGRKRRRRGRREDGQGEDDDDDDEAPVPLLQRVRETLGGTKRVNLVHRLDRGASGCVLCTMSEHETATHVLHQALTSPLARKTYVAIVRGEGVLRGEDLRRKGWFTVDRPIKDERGRLNNASTDFLFVAGQTTPSARPLPSSSSSSSASSVAPENDGEGEGGDPPFDSRCCVVLARPHTGRWHQIRRHLNGLSHPILGDSTHGNSRTNRAWRVQGGLPGARMCLHLARIELPPTAVTMGGRSVMPSSSSAPSSSDAEPEDGHHADPLSHHSGATTAGASNVDARCPLPADMVRLLQTHAPGLLDVSKAALEEEAGIVVVVR